MNGQKPFALRMMDANLNRVAEGLRVVEDILRFGFEDQGACKAVRALRHRVRDAFVGVYGDLLAGRNVQADPGVSISKEQVLDGKKSVAELLLANLKRAQEGLRVLEESAHLLGDRTMAKEVEDIRFATYELEQELSRYITTGQKRFSRRGTAWRLPEGIYALTSEPHSLGRRNLEVAEQILAAGVKILQYREKHKKQLEMYRECLVLREMTKKAGALFIVNDHLEIAVAVDADGVHVGQDDLPLELVRKIVGPDRIIGVSTHSPDQAAAAIAGGADYIGVGPIYATRTKTDVCEPVGLEYLNYIVNNLDIPFVAIGGIKEHNLKEVLGAGARTVALVTEIVGAPDIGEQIKSIKRAMESEASF